MQGRDRIPVLIDLYSFFAVELHLNFGREQHRVRQLLSKRCRSISIEFSVGFPLLRSDLWPESQLTNIMEGDNTEEQKNFRFSDHFLGFCFSLFVCVFRCRPRKNSKT